MAWLILTSAHIATALTGPELAAAQSAALAEGQESPLSDVIKQVSRYVRGRVAACERNRLAEGETIPDELLSPAIDIAVYRLAKRLRGKIIATQERIDAADKAEALMKDVAACSVALAQPVTITSEPVATTPAPRISARPRRFDSRAYDGA